MAVHPIKSRAVLYLRSSKDRSDVSIDSQRRELAQLATDRGYSIVGEFADVVESAKDDRRPAFQALRAELRTRARPWDAVLLLDPSRLSRNQLVAHVFTHEARERGVAVVYARMPASDPIVEILVLPLMHAIAELHSHDSKQKGLAGMAENVRQGWRAGGRAPRGYRLEHVETGAIREGEPVRKSRLVAAEDLPRIGAYLRDRAAGVPRRVAAERHGIGGAESTLVGMEWQALTYAGSTVWNVHAERTSTGYKGGSKRRPRAEWVVQAGTHEAVISEAEAETILARLAAYAPARERSGSSEHLLTGLLKTPAGAAWYADEGGRIYRTKGRTVRRLAIEGAVLARAAADLRSPEFVAAMLEATRQAHRHTHAAEIAAAREEIKALEVRAGLFLEMAAKLESQGPVLRKVDAIERDRERLARDVAVLEAQDQAARQLSAITERDVLALLDRMTSGWESLPAADLRALLAGMVERIELDPGTLSCAIHYRVAVDRNNLASPRGHVLIPALRAVGRLALG